MDLYWICELVHPQGMDLYWIYEGESCLSIRQNRCCCCCYYSDDCVVCLCLCCYGHLFVEDILHRLLLCPGNNYHHLLVLDLDPLCLYPYFYHFGGLCLYLPCHAALSLFQGDGLLLCRLCLDHDLYGCDKNC